MLNLNDKSTLALLEIVKRKLSILWNDKDTDNKLIDMMLDAEKSLNHLLGAECNYLVPGADRQLFLNYMLYCWNDVAGEFEDAYRSEIIRVRHKKQVEAAQRSVCGD